MTDDHAIDARGLPELPCRDFVECVTAYLDDGLTPVDRARFELHLQDCPHCLLYLEQLRAAARAAGRIDAEALPPRVREDLMRAFDAWAAEARDSA